MIRKSLKFFILLFLLTIVMYIIFNVIDIQTVIINVLYPRDYADEVNKYAKEYGVDENLVFAIIKAESNFNPNAQSRKNAKGLMQLMYETAVDVAKILNIEINEDLLLVPDININLGTKYLSILIEKYNCLEVAIAAYNAGSGNVDNWINNGTIKGDGSDIENIPFKETNNYVRKILRDYKIYEKDVDLFSNY